MDALEKYKNVGILAVGIAIGAGGSKLVSPTAEAAAPTRATLQNEHTWVATHLPDGGTVYGHRECTFVYFDGGHSEPPCTEWVLSQAQAEAFEHFSRVDRDGGK